MTDIAGIEEKLGVKFQNQDLILQALTHRSYLNENPSFQLGHNERLEFLGDAVLELVVTDHLYANYDLPEGELTNLRASIVKGEMLSRIATEIELGDFLQLSKGESRDTGKARQYILANAVESVIGAIYLDQGYATAEKFIHEYIVVKLAEVLAEGSHIDSKSKLQEIVQEKHRVTPTYRVLEETGADHDKHFIMGVYVKDDKIGQGEGSSKQEAQQQAAREALKKV